MHFNQLTRPHKLADLSIGIRKFPDENIEKVRNPLKSGGEEKTECFGNGVFSRTVSFREYSIREKGGNYVSYGKAASETSVKGRI